MSRAVSRSARVLGVLLAATAALATSSCEQGGLDAKAKLPPLDEAYFRCHVQPVLAKSCSQFACHGTPDRFFRVYARNRLRYKVKTRNALMSDEERQFNYDAARAFVDASAPETSLLLLKPLEAQEGGYFHRGATLYGGGNVFPNREDPDFKFLARWVNGAKEDKACIEPGSDQ